MSTDDPNARPLHESVRVNMGGGALGGERRIEGSVSFLVVPQVTLTEKVDAPRPGPDTRTVRPPRRRRAVQTLVAHEVETVKETGLLVSVVALAAVVL